MAKHRMRVCIGYNDDGSPVEKMVSGTTQRELADRIVLAILNSERRAEFFDRCRIPMNDSATGRHLPTFGEYAYQ